MSAHRRNSYSLLTILFLVLCLQLKPCQCPVTNLSKAECDKYEVILRGKILEVNNCGDKPGEATVEVLELFKGNAYKKFKLLFRCEGDCFYQFRPGEEWIIYSRYRQVNTAMMDFCSRSRRWFRNDREDYYTATNGNDYEDELKFLRQELGLHRLLAEDHSNDPSRNKVPNTNQTVLILLISLGVILLFYYLFSRFVK